jgi:hypothetical protein
MPLIKEETYQTQSELEPKEDKALKATQKQNEKKEETKVSDFKVSARINDKHGQLEQEIKQIHSSSVGDVSKSAIQKASPRVNVGKEIVPLPKDKPRTPEEQDDLAWPLTASKALKHFMTKLSDFEKGEILDYKQVYFLGCDSEKIKGSPLNANNYGFDDDSGDYNTVINDHIAYRF